MKPTVNLKGITLLCILTLLFAGCGKNEGTEKPGPDVQKEFDLASLPNDWVMLTPKNGGYIIFNSCDAGNLLLTIDAKKTVPTLLLHGTQEDDEFEILKSYIGSNDTIVLKARWKNDDKLLDFKFTWQDKARKIARWKAKYNDNYGFDFLAVPTNLQSQFPIVNQPCKECWGDECDEMEAAMARDNDTVK